MCRPGQTLSYMEKCITSALRFGSEKNVPAPEAEGIRHSITIEGAIVIEEAFGFE